MDNSRPKSGSYARIGTPKTTPSVVPIEPKEIGTRVAVVSDLIGTRSEAAAAAQVSVAALQRYIRGENMPPFDVAARLCLAAGVRLEWMATGQGEMKRSAVPASQPASQSLSGESLTMAIQLAAEALDGRSLPPPDYAELVGLIYEGLVEGLPEAKILRFARIGARGGQGRSDASREGDEDAPAAE